MIMSTRENFINQLNEAHELMSQEKYHESLIILEELKKIEEEGDFDYNLIHRLYQLISNSRSLHNQQIILQGLNNMAKGRKSISFQELDQNLAKNMDFNLKESELRKEVELLILRGKIICKISGNELIF